MGICSFSLNFCSSSSYSFVTKKISSFIITLYEGKTIGLSILKLNSIFPGFRSTVLRGTVILPRYLCSSWVINFPSYSCSYFWRSNKVMQILVSSSISYYFSNFSVLIGLNGNDFTSFQFGSLPSSQKVLSIIVLPSLKMTFTST